MLVLLLSISLTFILFEQSHLPPDGKPFGIILYADKTKLSSFGTAQGYPVVMQCSNLPGDICNGSGIGGGRVVGWLPIVSHLYRFNCAGLNFVLRL
jgi:hypothetical protein